MIEKLLVVSEIDSQLDFQLFEFQDDLDFTVLVLERARGSKLESTFSMKTWRILKETNNTITELLEKSEKAILLKERLCRSVRRTETNLDKE